MKKMIFTHFIIDAANKLIHNGQVKTAKGYLCAKNSFERFLADKQQPLVSDITQELVSRYDHYLRQCGICLNTVSCYMRSLRAAYNKAVEQGYSEQRFPFKGAFVKVEQTTKRSLRECQISRLMEQCLDGNPTLKFARALFVLSFMLRGISFVDLAHLKKTDLNAQSDITYRRSKTGQRITVHLVKEALVLLDYCANRDPQNPYLLRILPNDVGADAVTRQRMYNNALHVYNLRLKRLAKKTGLEVNLTSYVARHSWASEAQRQNIPVAVISEAMGHTSEKTTRIYLSGFGSEVINQANIRVLTYICNLF